MATIVNVAEIAAPDWTFVEPALPREHHWHHFSASPRNALERTLRKPNVARARACVQAVSRMGGGDEVVISHLPKTTHWLASAMRLSGRRNRHLAFAFNFTRLPQGREHQRMRDSFARVDRFVVYSEFERRLYAQHFDLPIERIDRLAWAMETPAWDPALAAAAAGRWCAVGGEGRDYATLVEAFRGLPRMKLTIVARPASLDGIALPPNVEFLHDVPHAHFWSVVRGARAVVVPLRDERTPCGHITLVGAMMHGKAIVSTRSEGTADYLHGGDNALLVPPRDPVALRAAIERVEEDDALRGALEAAGQRFVREHCDPRRWQRYVQSFIEGGETGAAATAAAAAAAPFSAAPAPPASRTPGR